MTISAVAERVPNLLLAVVYLAGFLVPNGLPLLAMSQHETLSSALSPGLFVGDPAAIGRAIRPPSAPPGSMSAQPTLPTDRDSELRFMAMCWSPNSRMRYRNFIATNRTPAPWPHQTLRLEDSARCRAITSAARRIVRFR